jgi:hypothetical protein
MTTQKFCLTAALSLLVLVLLPQLSGRQLHAQEKRFYFKIDPKAPLKDLLPVPPKATRQTGPALVDHLAKVPEMQFQQPLRTGNQWFPPSPETLMKQTAHQVAKINFLNRNQPDHFLEVLLENRPDLAGLPFVMGDACRLDKKRGESFRAAVLQVRVFLQGNLSLLNTATLFGKISTRTEKHKEEFIRAVMQMSPPDLSGNPMPLISHLAQFREKEATRAFARMALYSEENHIRQAALKVLEKRDRSEFVDQLLQGLNYPWPEVAKNAAAAMAHLKTTDLIPELIQALDQPDPRLPVLKNLNGMQVSVVREVVRINHHRNCLLCHPPGNTSDVKVGEVLTGAVPNPGESLSPTFYESRSPDILVRADVTYLRPDFSRMQKVAHAAPWPETQRFDFLVRTRILSEAEAKSFKAEFARREKPSPYRQAALTALRALTGRDAEPTAEAWRKVLALPAP